MASSVWIGPHLAGSPMISWRDKLVEEIAQIDAL